MNRANYMPAWNPWGYASLNYGDEMIFILFWKNKKLIFGGKAHSVFAQ